MTMMSASLPASSAPFRWSRRKCRAGFSVISSAARVRDMPRSSAPLTKSGTMTSRPGTPEALASISGLVLRSSDQLTWSVETIVTVPSATCRQSFSTSARGRIGGLILALPPSRRTSFSSSSVR
ncbi:hypothetical protein D9M69_651120 [compost metagenome]